METETTFDLSGAIQAWRDNLGQSPHFRLEDLEEMEGHLRDSVTALRAGGLSEEEAFLIAARRLGGAPTLRPEFAKVNGREVWLDRALWMLTGLLLWGALSGLLRAAVETGVMAGLLGFGYSPSLSHTLLPSILFGAAHLAGVGLCVAGCLWVFRHAANRMAQATAYLVERPSRMLLAAVGISLVLLACPAADVAERVYLMHRLGPDGFGALIYSRTLGSVVTIPLVTFALVTAAFLLARIRMRRGARV